MKWIKSFIRKFNQEVLKNFKKLYLIMDFKYSIYYTKRVGLNHVQRTLRTLPRTFRFRRNNPLLINRAG